PHAPPPTYFVFYAARALPDLHSFPTRRSSDLGEFVGAPVVAQRRALCLRNFEYTRKSCDALAQPLHKRGRAAFVVALRPRLCRRSDEHTSELQSRGHLVCRLLLEKKKNQKINV